MTLQELEALTPIKALRLPDTKIKFCSIWVNMHKTPQEEAAQIYENELRYFDSYLTKKDSKIANATRISILSTFYDIAINGVSIKEGGRLEAYPEGGSTKATIDGVEKWINNCFLKICAYGELSIRYRTGQIAAVFNPQVLYEGDHFQPKTDSNGALYVDYQPKFPRDGSEKITGCYIRIALKNGFFDYKWMGLPDIERLKKCSMKMLKNTTGNALYSSNNEQIDVGFLEAKMIKHAFKTIGKLKVSSTVVIESEQDEDDEEAESFSDPIDKPNGVKIDIDESVSF